MATVETDPEKFLRWISNAARTVEELRQMQSNAVARDRHDLAAMVEERLRSMKAAKRAHRGGRETPTRARYLTDERQFPSGKDAYVWLVARLLGDHREVLEPNSWQGEYVNAGRSQKYFAMSADELFPNAQDSSERSSVCLPNGWYANLNLDHRQKFEILCRVGALANLEYQKEWDWQVDGATVALIEAQKAVVRSAKLVEEFFRKIQSARANDETPNG